MNFGYVYQYVSQDYFITCRFADLIQLGIFVELKYCVQLIVFPPNAYIFGIKVFKTGITVKNLS